MNMEECGPRSQLHLLPAQQSPAWWTRGGLLTTDYTPQEEIFILEDISRVMCKMSGQYSIQYSTVQCVQCRGLSKCTQLMGGGGAGPSGPISLTVGLLTAL